jgi:hypothetical protein
MSKKQYGALIGIALATLIAVLGVFGYEITLPDLAPPTEQEAALAGGFSVPCHTEMGGVGYTCDSGGAFAVNSGASLTVAAGATATFAGVTTFTGAVTVNDIDVQGVITTSSVTIPDNVTITDTLTVSGTVKLGDAGDTVAIDSSDWDISATGAMTGIGAITADGLVTASGGVAVSVPTAAATATPAMLINNIGATNDGLVVAKNGTPVFKVSNAGAVTGNLLRYASSGQQIICGSTTITGTGSLPHALATPQFVQLSLAEDVTGDCARLSYTNASATVTAKCWNSALTPAAATTPVAVNWCVIGTP